MANNKYFSGGSVSDLSDRLSVVRDRPAIAGSIAAVATALAGLFVFSAGGADASSVDAAMAMNGLAAPSARPFNDAEAAQASDDAWPEMSEAQAERAVVSVAAAGRFGKSSTDSTSETTVSSTTAPPTTEAPTTAAPTTAAPTTAAPTTAAPTTAESTTAPTTAEPATTEPPATEPTTTAPPATETTTTAPPATEPPPAAPAGWVDTGNGVMVPPVLLKIRFCESTDNYQAANRYSSARGAYQFLTGSWSYYGHAKRYGVSRAHYATPAQQDEAALITWQRDGTRPWKASQHCWG